MHCCLLSVGRFDKVMIEGCGWVADCAAQAFVFVG
jgi:hypothetical protein